jgi:hypothetical protein
MRRKSKSDAHGISFMPKKLFFVGREFYFVNRGFLHIAKGGINFTLSKMNDGFSLSVFTSLPYAPKAFFLFRSCSTVVEGPDL